MKHVLHPTSHCGSDMTSAIDSPPCSHSVLTGWVKVSRNFPTVGCVLVGLALAGCGPKPEDALVEEAHVAVLALMKDPESARFDDRKAEIYPSEGLVCNGSVNAKNSFGGYVGAQEYSYKRGKGATLDAVGQTVEATEIFGACVDALSEQIKRSQRK